MEKVTGEETFHLDRGEIFKHEITDEGDLRFHARIARTGELKYLNADGSERIERVTPEVLFDKASMDTFKLKRITAPKHPNKLLTIENENEYSDIIAGKTGNLVTREVTLDGDFLGIVGVIDKKWAIESIQRGDTKEVSCGYLATTKPLPDGTFEQTKRIGNHLALVPHGRAGSQVKISLDSMPVYIQDSDFTPSFNMTDTKEKTTFIKLDEFESIEVPIGISDKIANRLKTDNAIKTDMKKQLDELKAQLDVLKTNGNTASQEYTDMSKKYKDMMNKYKKMEETIEEKGFKNLDSLFARLDELTAQLDTANEELEKADIPALVKARVQLERKCDGLLPDGFNTATSSDRELMASVIINHTKLDCVDSLSDDYVKARFDSVIELQEKQDTSNVTRAAANQSGETVNSDKLSELEKLRLDAEKTRLEYLASFETSN